MIKVAILMSHYDGDKFVDEQIKSILNQKVNSEIKVDLYVRDDGSPTSDLHILRKYQIDGKLTLFEEKNIGVKLSFYRLMELVSGYDYYFFADQDDIWAENKIQVMVNELRKYPKTEPVGVYSDLYVADKNAKPTGKLMKKGKHDITPGNYHSTDEYILRYYFVTGASFAFNQKARDAAILMGGDYFKKTKMHDGAMAFILVSTGKLIFIDQPLVYYRQHGGNLVGADHKQSFWKNVKDLNDFLDAKVGRLYGMYLVAEKLQVPNNERNNLIQSMFKKNFMLSPYYAWKLRKQIYKNKFVLLEILFLIFGISSVRKRQIIEGM